jgi:spoIIIJ-associated protein
MADEEQKQRALAFAQGLAEASGLDVSAAVSRDEPEGVTIAFDGPDARMLIGRSGQCLDALQYIASLIVNRRGTARIHITFDADGYRVRRENTLIRLASELAQQVIATGQEAVLDPMSALERRIVHNALAGEPGVRTYSEGEEPERYLVIAPATSAK